MKQTILKNEKLEFRMAKYLLFAMGIALVIGLAFEYLKH